MKLIKTFGVLALLGVASSASALVITAGPTYSLPGGGSCTVSGAPCLTGGATVSCTGVALGSHSNVYFGIRNDLNVIGNTMTGAAPVGGSVAVFRYSSNTTSSITYASSTTVADQIHGTQTVSNQLVLTLTGGTASTVATGGNPADSAINGDIRYLFKVT